MKILLLGCHYNKLGPFLESFGDKIVEWEPPISGDSAILKDIGFIISYGYRHIIRKTVIDAFQEKIINLHISLLPYNRGADPNLWSFLEDSPKGVTIHFINEGVDTGDILLQVETSFPQDATLTTSYDILSETVEQLFKDHWQDIRDGKIESIPQSNCGSVHRSMDKNKFAHLLKRGWDTPTTEIAGKAKNEIG